MIDLYSLKDTALVIWKAIKIETIIKRIKYGFNYYFSTPVKLLVLGESGTGKTQFINSILSNIPIKSHRTHLSKRNVLVFENGKKVVFIDSPGHKTLQAERKKVIDEIRRKKITGIINVVNYGYNESDTAQDLNIFRTGTCDVKEEYLRENRIREIAQLSEWEAEITLDCKLKNIVTIVNKADIWYSQYENVLNYYEKGEYAQRLKLLGNISCHCFPYCSIIEPFYNKPMSIIIGEQKKKELHDDLINEFINVLFN